MEQKMTSHGTKSDEKKMDLKSVECDPSCGFMIRSHDESEIVHTTMKHVRDMHDKSVSPQDIRTMMKTAA